MPCEKFFVCFICNNFLPVNCKNLYSLYSYVLSIAYNIYNFILIFRERKVEAILKQLYRSLLNALEANERWALVSDLIF